MTTSKIKGWLLACALPIAMGSALVHIEGCAGLLRDVESVSNPADDANLSRCRAVGRDAAAHGDGSREARESAFDAYDRCVRDAGLR